jgi:hypothetical protein
MRYKNPTNLVAPDLAKVINERNQRRPEITISSPDQKTACPMPYRCGSFFSGGGGVLR